jgi:phosphoglycolate phosphatase
VVRLILFDVDGTLIRTQGAGVKAFGKAFESEFKVAEATRAIDFAGRTDPSIVRDVFKRHQIEASPANFQRFFECYVFWLDYLLCTTHGEICPGVWNFIHSLARLPVPPLTGLLTGNIRLGAEIKLRHFQIWDYFGLGAFGDDHENRDELAVIARQRGSEALGTPLRGDEIMVIGDTPNDVQCGRKIQAKTLAVATGAFKMPELEACRATWTVPNLSDLDARPLCA